MFTALFSWCWTWPKKLIFSTIWTKSKGFKLLTHFLRFSRSFEKRCTIFHNSVPINCLRTKVLSTHSVILKTLYKQEKKGFILQDGNSINWYSSHDDLKITNSPSSFWRRLCLAIVLVSKSGDNSWFPCVGKMSKYGV